MCHSLTLTHFPSHTDKEQYLSLDPPCQRTHSTTLARWLTDRPFTHSRWPTDNEPFLTFISPFTHTPTPTPTYTGAYCDYTKSTANQSCDMAHPHNRGTTIQNFWWCFNPMETIALYTASSELPAPPFTLNVTAGRCVMPSGV